MAVKERCRVNRFFPEVLEERRLLAAEINGFVWNDWNQDGEREKPQTEYRVAEVAVNLLSDQLEIVAGTRTDDDGVYHFCDVPSGSYLLEFVAPDGAQFTRPFATRPTKDSNVDPETGRTNVFQVGEAGDIDDIDAGVYAPFGTADLTGTVWHDRNADGMLGRDEPKIAKAEVQLENVFGEKLMEVRTDEDGSYVIPGSRLLPGNYVIDFVRPDSKEPRWQISPKHVAFNVDSDVDSDADVANGKTDAFTLEAIDRNEQRERVWHAAGFFRSATIQGSVWHDQNRDGLWRGEGEFGVQSVDVHLVDEEGREIDKAETDRNGDYLLVVPTPGDYTVQFDLHPGTEFTAVDQGSDRSDSDVSRQSGRTEPINIRALQQITHVSAGIFSANGTPSVTGRVWHDLNANGFQDPNEPGVAGTEVQLENTSLVKLTEVLTNSDGDFSFDGRHLLPDRLNRRSTSESLAEIFPPTWTARCELPKWASSVTVTPNSLK